MKRGLSDTNGKGRPSFDGWGRGRHGAPVDSGVGVGMPIIVLSLLEMSFEIGGVEKLGQEKRL